uniref:Transmembrane protein 256 homolog n=1 Tax=Kalanchoe fedtschenkoi TaxID=63787 RepID=A0A7N0RA15_KALFE
MSVVVPFTTAEVQQELEKSARFSISEMLRSMDPLVWHKVAAVSGMAAIGLGAYGSHVFKPKNLAYKDVWQTAALYHLVHSAALLSAPMVKHPHIFGGLLTTGILAFSGTCYGVAVLEDRKYSALAPFGGFAFIAAWGSLLF